jgi:hypothetical protein
LTCASTFKAGQWKWGGSADQGEYKMIMKEATKRSIVRWIHIVCSIPIIGYIYSPFEVLPDYAPATRFVFFPVMLLSGLWMWKGHVLRRLVGKNQLSDVRRAA